MLRNGSYKSNAGNNYKSNRDIKYKNVFKYMPAN